MAVETRCSCETDVLVLMAHRNVIKAGLHLIGVGETTVSEFRRQRSAKNVEIGRKKARRTAGGMELVVGRRLRVEIRRKREKIPDEEPQNGATTFGPFSRKKTSLFL